jgi:hypothetical protein
MSETYLTGFNQYRLLQLNAEEQNLVLIINVGRNCEDFKKRQRI